MATLDDRIHLIQFLDFLSISILIPSVPSTILKMGATPIHLGVMMSSFAVAKIISGKVYGELLKVTGKRLLLKYSLMASLAVNASLLFTSSVTWILLNRALFMFVNQVAMLCAQLGTKSPNHSAPYKNTHTQSLVAALMGCAFVGSLIDYKGGFYVLVAIGTTISAVSVAIFLQLEPKEKEKEKPLSPAEAVRILPKVFSDIITAIRNVEIHLVNWDALLVKTLLITNATVTFILFVVFMRFAFHSNGAWLNTTSAYQKIVIFLCGMITSNVNSHVANFSKPQKILEISSIACAVCALFAGFAPTYSFYLFMFMPLIISRNIVESYFVNAFELKQNPKLEKDIKAITVIANIVTPLFIGLIFYLLGYNAYRLLTVAPLVGIYFVVKNKKYRNTKAEMNSDTKKQLRTVETNKDK